MAKLKNKIIATRKFGMIQFLDEDKNMSPFLSDAMVFPTKDHADEYLKHNEKTFKNVDFKVFDVYINESK